MFRLGLVFSLFSAITTMLCTHVALAQEDDDMINCTLCVDPLATPNDPDARINTGTETLTCQDLYDRGALLLPEENCTSLHTIGRILCLCEGDAPTLHTNCTLCEDGSPLPRPLQEGLPDESCAELQIDAQRDDPNNCLAWQGTVGMYCGCPNNVVSNTVLQCRICGNDTQLPNPLDVEYEHNNSTNETTNNNMLSCGELELEANTRRAAEGGASCSAYQAAYSDFCCRNVSPPPTPMTSGGVARYSPTTVTMVTFAAFVLSTVLIMAAVTSMVDVV